MPLLNLQLDVDERGNAISLNFCSQNVNTIFVRLSALIAVGLSFLPYVAGNDTGVHAALYELITRFSSIPQHRMLAPFYVAWIVCFLLTSALPGHRIIGACAIVASGFWCLFMLLIPMGFAHVRPLFGYWLSQAAIISAIVLMIRSHKENG